ncbi:hypothetical protein BK126_04470 [Paenibacillus sp. FSL H7-0326]|uniref:phage major capsid protein n=2 Tax=Bacillati TaxID=1783272 RepID=UPI00096F29B4|nr:phage major capsid protein [Paenibacillus sp. FSL H7-0326]OMC71357.1 hypothetical protein BK126_04470 [Paenibacillus sp. FSL H7-0326]
MNKKDYLAKRQAMLNEAEALINAGKYEEYEAKEKEITSLDNEFEESSKNQANANALKDRFNNLAGAPVAAIDGGELEKMNNATNEAIKAAEERAVALKNNREVKYSANIIVPRNAVTLTSTGIIAPRIDSDTIEPTFNKVSSLIDRVRVINRMGGESFRQPYVAGYGLGGYSADNADYNTTDPTFGSAMINKSKITAYTEEDEGVLKLPSLDYDAEIQKNIRIALRSKMSREILIGGGETEQFVGIFDEAATAIDPATDKSFAAITADTLDEIVFSYGGAEDVEDEAVLILNKIDLMAFVKLRDGNGNRIHKIVTSGNTGTIDGIPFIINSACKPLSAAGSAAGDYSMAYGNLSGYGLAIFSDIDTRRSEDFKFKSGQIAYRGSVYAGGNVIRKNGFLRVKKS